MGTCRLQVYFEVAKPQPDGPGIDYSQLDDSCRFIQYQFPAEVLSLNNIGTTCAAAAVDLQPHMLLTRVPAVGGRRLAFCVGNDAVSNFRMIERHYFRDRLLKSFDFTFPFWSARPRSPGLCTRDAGRDCAARARAQHSEQHKHVGGDLRRAADVGRREERDDREPLRGARPTTHTHPRQTHMHAQLLPAHVRLGRRRG